MHSLAQRVLFHIRQQELLRAGDRVGVAVSGGIDSVALLRVLLELRGELGIVLSVVHFNHKLRGPESDADAEFVAGLAREHELEFFADGDDAARQASEEHVSVEAAARELRYGFFRYLLGSEGYPSEAQPQIVDDAVNRGAGSAAPPKDDPQGLKPDSSKPPVRGPEGPLFHGGSDGPAKSRLFVGDSEDAAGSGVFSGEISDQSVSRVSLDKIPTGHTLDDQAETVVMRMIRGTGLRGLGAIHPRIAVEDDDGEVCGEIIRPLLGIRRRELEQYLKELGQGWREDSSNADDSFTRNRMRQRVMPLLEEEFNPSVSENLAELAEIARGEEDYWENEVAGWMGTVVQWSEPEWRRGLSAGDSLVQIQLPAAEGSGEAFVELSGGREPEAAMDASVDRRWLLGEPVAVQRRLVKAIGEHAGIALEFKHVEEILRFAGETVGKQLSLPRGWAVAVEPEALVFLAPDLRAQKGGRESHEKTALRDYEYTLNVPGQVTVREIGWVIEALSVPATGAGYNPEHLLDSELLRGPLRVRNWRPGDRFWPAHTKAPKKIKELLQERHVGQPERGLWPVVVMGEEIVWVQGFAVPAKLRAKAGQAGVLIRETATRGDDLRR